MYLVNEFIEDGEMLAKWTQKILFKSQKQRAELFN